jgi:hypothetical protein
VRWIGAAVFVIASPVATLIYSETALHQTSVDCAIVLGILIFSISSAVENFYHLTKKFMVISNLYKEGEPLNED